MRPPRTRLRSTAQQQTDATLLQLHALIADKLIAQPELVPPLLAKLEQRYQAGLIKHWGYIRWYSMLYPSDFKMQISAGDKSALGKAAVGRFGGSKARTANAA